MVLAYSFLLDFSLPNVAVLNIAPSFPGSSSPALLATTFAGFGKTPSYYVPNLAQLVAGGGTAAVTPVQLEDSAVWSNEIEMVAPSTIPGLPSSALTAGGFLVPGKSTGSIDLWDVSVRPAQRTQLSTDKKGWFYHHLEYFDVNGPPGPSPPHCI